MKQLFTIVVLLCSLMAKAQNYTWSDPNFKLAYHHSPTSIDSLSDFYANFDVVLNKKYNYIGIYDQMNTVTTTQKTTTATATVAGFNARQTISVTQYTTISANPIMTVTQTYFVTCSPVTNPKTATGTATETVYVSSSPTTTYQTVTSTLSSIWGVQYSEDGKNWFDFYFHWSPYENYRQGTILNQGIYNPPYFGIVGDNINMGGTGGGLVSKSIPFSLSTTISVDNDTKKFSFYNMLSNAALKNNFKIPSKAGSLLYYRVWLETYNTTATSTDPTWVRTYSQPLRIQLKNVARRVIGFSDYRGGVCKSTPHKSNINQYNKYSSTLLGGFVFKSDIPYHSNTVPNEAYYFEKNWSFFEGDTLTGIKHTIQNIPTITGCEYSHATAFPSININCGDIWIDDLTVQGNNLNTLTGTMDENSSYWNIPNLRVVGCRGYDWSDKRGLWGNPYLYAWKTTLPNFFLNADGTANSNISPYLTATPDIYTYGNIVISNWDNKIENALDYGPYAMNVTDTKLVDPDMSAYASSTGIKISWTKLYDVCSVIKDYESANRLIYDRRSTAYLQYDDFRVYLSRQEADNPKSWKKIYSIDNVEDLKNIRNFKDEDAIPGVTYLYKLDFKFIDSFNYKRNSNNAVVEYLAQSDCVMASIEPKGSISGHISTKTGADVSGVAVMAYATINGKDYVYGGETDPSGDYSITGMFTGFDNSGVYYSVTPSLPGHSFNPQSKVSQLNPSIPNKTNVNFTDTTAISITGRVTFKGTNNCPSPGNSIYLDNGLEPQKTSGAGTFNLGKSPKDMYTLSLQNNQHLFSPATTQIEGLSDIDNVDFLDLTTDTLNITAKTGCGGRYADSIQVRIYAGDPSDACLDSTIILKPANNYNVSLVMPAQVTNVVMQQIWPANTNIFNLLSSVRQINLGDTTFKRENNGFNIDYTYFGRIDVLIKGFKASDSVCVGTDKTLYFKQDKAKEFYYDIVEAHNDYAKDIHQCPIDTGYVIVTDYMSTLDNIYDTIPVRNGSAYYEIVPGVPNFSSSSSHPYQKNVAATYYSLDPTVLPVTAPTVWGVIEGMKSRQSTFITKTPQMPLMILHDPPGSASSAYWRKGTSVETSIGTSMSNAWDIGGYTDSRIGAGVFFPVAGRVGGDLHLQIDLGAGIEAEDNKATITMTSTSENVSTSDSPDFVGENADIVIGSSFNNTYSLADILKYDATNCSVSTSIALAWGKSEFATTYMYTIGHIKSVIIPDLVMLQSLQTNEDSITKYQSYIEVWQQVVDRNHEAIEKADFIRNRSFSAGTIYDYEEEVDTTCNNEITYTGKFDFDAAIGFHGQIDEFKSYEAGIKTSYHFSSGTTNASSKNNSTAFGYRLYDDVDGNYYSVDICRDKKFNSIAFRTIAGVSSCPAQPNTQVRSRPQIVFDNNTVSNIPPTGQGVYKITINDLSDVTTQGVTSNAYNTYQVKLDNITNPGGAVFKIGGVNIASDQYLVNIPRRSSATLLMTVERGPMDYSYQNIGVMVVPNQCEQDAANSFTQNDDVISTYDEGFVNAYFQTNCKPVTMVQPYDGQVLAKTTDNTVQITFSDFDKTNNDINAYNIQYKSESADNWNLIKRVSLSDLMGQFYDFAFDCSKLLNGTYMFRVETDCKSGKNYSEIRKVIIDRKSTNAAFLVGNYPSNGFLTDTTQFIGAVYSAKLKNVALVTGFRFKNLTDDKYITLTPSVKFSNDSVIVKFTGKDLQKLDTKTIQVQLSGICDEFGNQIQLINNWQFQIDLSNFNWRNNTLVVNNSKGKTLDTIVYLDNKGDADVQYELSSPNFVVPNLSTGTTPQKSFTAVKLSFNGNYNSGTYKDTIFAKNKTNNKKMPLVVTYNIAFAPTITQTVTKTADSKQMTVIAQIQTPSSRTAKLTSTDVNDVVYAYSNNVLVGKSNIKYDPAIQKYYCSVTVYSSATTTTTQTIDFKFWIGAEGTLYTAKEKTTFVSATTVGTTTSPYVLTTDYYSSAFIAPSVVVPITISATPLTQTLYSDNLTNVIKFSSNKTDAVFSWTNDTPSIGLAAFGSGSSIAPFAVSNSTSAPITATLQVTAAANGTTSSPIAITIIVVPPSSPVTITPVGIDMQATPQIQTVNSGTLTSAVFFTSETSGVTYSWNNDNTSIGLRASGYGANIPAFVAVNRTASPITATIVVTPTLNTNTGDAISISIIVLPETQVQNITMQASPQTQSVNDGGLTTAINFSSSISGVTFRWSNDNTSIGLAASGTSSIILPFITSNKNSTSQVANIVVTPSLNGKDGTPVVVSIVVGPKSSSGNSNTNTNTNVTQEEPLNLNPSPVKTILNIVPITSYQTKTLPITVLDDKGRKIASLKIKGNYQYDMSKLTSGLYFFLYMVDGKQHIQKITKVN